MKTKSPRKTKTEKADADARMQHFLKCLKFQRIFEAAQRHGWHVLTEEEVQHDVWQFPPEGAVIIHHDGHTYRVEQYFTGPGRYLTRRIA